MTVAVKNVPETSAAGLLDHLAIVSLAGAAYVAAALWAVFFGVPSLWSSIWREGAAVSVAFMVLVMAGVAGGLAFVGGQLYRQFAKPGLRAGIFLGLVALLVLAEVTSAVGAVLQHSGSPSGVGFGVMGLVAAALAGGVGYAASRPQFDGWLTTLEDQGWFSVTSYKRNQGARVRRATLLGIVVVVGCGIYTLLTHRTLSVSASWNIAIPYTDLVIPLLPHVGLTLPIVLTVLAAWVGWRVVNFPVFADFLIATEAEMNKVSWTSRKRLVQDTVVVLVTVLLLTVFLFVVDMAWAWSLTKIGVLQQAQPGTQTTVLQEPSY